MCLPGERCSSFAFLPVLELGRRRHLFPPAKASKRGRSEFSPIAISCFASFLKNESIGQLSFAFPCSDKVKTGAIRSGTRLTTNELLSNSCTRYPQSVKESRCARVVGGPLTHHADLPS